MALLCMCIIVSKEEKSRSTKQRQQDNDNTSFSRIDYDGLNESVDEVEEDELDEVSTSHRSLSSQAGKPKILTFAGDVIVLLARIHTYVHTHEYNAIPLQTAQHL